MPPTTDSPDNEPAVRVRDIRKSFGLLEALRGVSLDLPRGEFLTLFGPNGAGKTTLLKILCALTKPTSGEVRVMGCDVLEGDPALRNAIGVISHMSGLYGDLTPLENMLFYAKMYGLENPRDRAAAVIAEVGLAARMHDRVQTFSRGMLQRLTIARAIIHNPSLLLLDEPYTGLDLHASHLLRDRLAALHNGKRTVIMTTHDMDRGLDISDKVAILVKGKLAFMESTANIDRNSFEKFYFDTVDKAR